MQQARVRLAGMNPEGLDDIYDDVRGAANKTSVSLNRPIPLPTKTLGVPARRSLDGEGTATWEHWEMHIHKRLIDPDADERTLRQLMRVQVPNDVSIKVALEG